MRIRQIRVLFRSSNILAILFIAAMPVLLAGQSMEFCGKISSSTATSTDPDSIVYDRFGNVHNRYPSEHSDAVIVTAGYFDLNFDISNLDPNLPDVITEVFEALALLIEQRTNIAPCGSVIEPSPIRIDILEDDNAPSSVLASGSPTFLALPQDLCSDVRPNVAQLKINGGFFADALAGKIMINSDPTITWHTDWQTTPSAGNPDAYTVFLHEALHVLGIASLIESDGTGTKVASDEIYTVWDSHINTTTSYNPSGPSSNLSQVLTSDCLENCWSLSSGTFPSQSDFTDALNDNCSSAGLDFVIGTNAIAPIQGGTNLPNDLSHLHRTCNGQNEDYVMLPGIDIANSETRRAITSAEEDILCLLGYKLTSCDGCFITAHPEARTNTSGQSTGVSSCCQYVVYGCVNEQFALDHSDLLCNDFSNGTLEISSFTSPSVELAVVNTGTSFLITGSAQGAYRLYYDVSGCDCSMATSFVEVYIGPCIDCLGVSPCDNLICTDGFEEFSSIVDASANFAGSIVACIELLGHYWLNDSGDNSTDFCRDKSNNNTYLHFGNHNSNPEALGLKLQEPVEPGCTLQVSFEASAAKERYFQWFVSEFPPCEARDTRVERYCSAVTECETHTYSPNCIQDILVARDINASGICPEEVQLISYSFEWENTYGYPVNYLFVGAQSDETSDINNYLDNITVTKVCIDPCFTYEIIEDCGEIQFIADDQDAGVTHHWDFGDGNSSTLVNPIHTYSSAGTYTVTHTVTDGCGNSQVCVHDMVYTDGDCCEDFTISANTVWSVSNPPPNNGIFHTLTVQHGYSLTVENDVTLAFCEGGSLVIEDGAYVRNDGKFTSLGDFMWEGVFVQGQPTLSQATDCFSTGYQCLVQGYFWADDDAVIEHAKIGVRNYGPGPQFAAGGMIKATDAVFRDNAVAVDFKPYQNYGPTGQPRPSLGSFSECQFFTTSSYSLDEPFEKFINVLAVDGIRIVGCTFDSDLNLVEETEYLEYGVGIDAQESIIEVYAKHTEGADPGPCEHPCILTEPTTFDGLGHGIRITSAKSVKPYTIVQCEFTNCYRGITSINTPGGTMVHNTFKLGPVPERFLQTAVIGIELAFTHAGFELQENTFEFSQSGSIANGHVIGISVNGLGSSSNFIRKNTFDGLLVGNAAIGPNGLIGDIPRGLRYLCNNNTNTKSNGFDYLVGNSENLDFISVEQADFDVDAGERLAAANKFAYTGVDIENFGDEIFAYYYYPQGANEEPLSGTGYNPYAEDNQNLCVEEICVPPCLSTSNLDDRKDDYYAFKGLSQHYYGEYLSATDSVKAQTNLALASGYQLHADKSAYEVVAHLWRDTLTYNLDTLIKWYGNLDAYGADLMIAGLHAYAGDMNQALLALQDIYLSRSLTDAQTLDLSLIIDMYSLLASRSIDSLSVYDLSFIRTIAQSDIGTSSGIARAILLRFGEYYPLPYVIGNQQIVHRNVSLPGHVPPEASFHSLEMLTAYPVPAKDRLNVNWHGPAETSLKGFLVIYDVYGSIMTERIIMSGISRQIDVSSWPKGIYFVNVIADDADRWISKKIIVH